MAGAVPSTLHQIMNLLWKNEELVIHGEGSHGCRQVPFIYEIARYIFLHGGASEYNR